MCRKKVTFVEDPELQLYALSEVTSNVSTNKGELEGSSVQKIAPEHNFQSPDSAPEWEQAKVLVPLQKLYYQLDTVTRDKLLNIISDVKKKSVPCITYVIEFCCDEDSELGKQSKTLKNVEVLRVTERMDAMSPQTLKTLLDYADKHHGCHIHSSIPCTAWTNVQNLNVAMHGEPFRKYLKRIQAESRVLFGRFLTLARVIKKNGGMVSFEWPPTVSGWKEPLVIRGLTELGCESVDIHGCYFGLKSARDPNVFITEGYSYIL